MKHLNDVPPRQTSPSDSRTRPHTKPHELGLGSRWGRPALVGLLSAGLLACVNHEPGLGSVSPALTAEQCDYFQVDGKVQICHKTGSSRKGPSETNNRNQETATGRYRSSTHRETRDA